MFRLSLSIAMLCLITLSCTNKTKKTASHPLNTNNLEIQSFYVNTKVDTILVSKSGCVLRIPANAFESDSQFLKLDFKEALTNTDIMLAGLSTMSGNNPLATGGMVFLNPTEGYSATIKKKIEVSVPTDEYTQGMQAYKGIENGEGNIDWVEPQPLPADTTTKLIEIGKSLFNANCRNCHQINGVATGPELAYLTERVPKDWIYKFVNNPARSNDPYSRELKEKWQASGIMTAFTQLSKYDIDGILAYIETEKKPRTYSANNLTLFTKDTSNANFEAPCYDSCSIAMAGINELEQLAGKIQRENDSTYFSLDRTISTSSNDDFDNENLNSLNDQSELALATITPNSVNATFYTININAFGWHNIDILMKDAVENCAISELIVQLNSTPSPKTRVMLAIPSVKVFINGELSSNRRDFVFDQLNGQINLPQKTLAHIIVVDEDNEKVFYGHQTFLIKQTQTIKIAPKEFTKEELSKAIRNLNLGGIRGNVDGIEITPVLDSINNQIKKLEAQKPKGCSCGSFV